VYTYFYFYKVLNFFKSYYRVVLFVVFIVLVVIYLCL
jgi:hypothetical protein